MPLISVTFATPAENELILIHDRRSNRVEFGRYVNGRWYLENLLNGQLSEISGVTHWGPVLDSEINDDSDDD
jgi:hypothetical protein